MIIKENLGLAFDSSYGAKAPTLSATGLLESSELSSIYDKAGGTDTFSVVYGEVLLVVMQESDYRNGEVAEAYGGGIGLGTPIGLNSETCITTVVGINLDVLLQNIDQIIENIKSGKDILENIKNPFGAAGVFDFDDSYGAANRKLGSKATNRKLGYMNGKRDFSHCKWTDSMHYY